MLYVFYYCESYMFFHRNDQFGDKTGGYRYYDQQRAFVKASRTTFISRDLYQLFVSAGYGNFGLMLSCLEPISVSKQFVCGVQGF